jgi:hypothetical protein
MARPISFPSFPAHHKVARRFGQILTERWLCLCNFWTVLVVQTGYKVAQNLATFQAKSSMLLITIPAAHHHTITHGRHGLLTD